MNLIEHATHAQNTLDQLTIRIDELAAEHTQALAAKDAENAQALAAKDVEIAALKQAVAELETLKVTMEATVATVLQSGDPAQYEALAKEFLKPAELKAREAKLAQIEELRRQVAELESGLP